MARATAGQKQLTRQFDRTLDRATFRLALVRAARCPSRPAVAGDAARRAEGTMVDEALIDAKLDAWYRAASLEDEKTRLDLLANGTPPSSRRRRTRSCRRAAHLADLQGRGEEGRRAYGRPGAGDPLYTEALKQALGGRARAGRERDAAHHVRDSEVAAPAVDGAGRLAFTVASQILAKDTGRTRSTRAEAPRGDQGAQLRAVRGRGARRGPADRLRVRTSTSPAATRARRRMDDRGASSAWRSTATRRARLGHGVRRDDDPHHPRRRAYSSWTMDSR